MGAFAVVLGVALRPTMDQTVEGTRQMLAQFATHASLRSSTVAGLFMTPDSTRRSIDCGTRIASTFGPDSSCRRGPEAMSVVTSPR